jgi:hypothetical protein
MYGELLNSDLYQSLIIGPRSRGANQLKIVSGYISPAFVKLLSHGAEENLVAPILGDDIELSITYGMYPRVGVTKADHDYFLNAMRTTGIEIRYYNPSRLHSPPECHSKVYLWQKDGKPTEAFCGSVNATGVAFFSNGRESAVACDPDSAQRYFEKINSMSIDASDVKDLLVRPQVSITPSLEALTAPLDLLDFVDLPLTQRGLGTEVHEESGLNWGQRSGRDPNQAYLPIPVEIQKSGFFPPRGVQFMVYTDDGDQFMAARRQENGKALHSIDSNAILGSWFRHRLGLGSGEFVTLQALSDYGRMTARIYKLSSGDYLLEFKRKSTDEQSQA